MLGDQAADLGARSRFVLLRHQMPPDADRASHWDLMIEREGVFVTYALEVLPGVPGAYLAQLLPDHRLAYWDLEGPISGNRGSVQRVARGFAVLSLRSDGALQCLLESSELSASLMLEPQGSSSQKTIHVVRWDWARPQSQDQSSAR